MNKEFYNDKGYPDPTAYRAIRKNWRQSKAKFLIRIILFIVWEAGFRVCGKIELEDRTDGRHYS